MQQQPSALTTSQPTVDWGRVEFTTYCPQASNNCVQYAKLDGMVAVRSSLTPDNVATLTPDEWANLLSGARSGEIA